MQSWDVFFRNASAGAPPGAAYQGPSHLSRTSERLSSAQALVGTQPSVEKLVEDHLAVHSLIRAYQVNCNHTEKVLSLIIVELGFCFILVSGSDTDCVTKCKDSKTHFTYIISSLL